MLDLESSPGMNRQWGTRFTERWNIYSITVAHLFWTVPSYLKKPFMFLRIVSQQKYSCVYIKSSLLFFLIGWRGEAHWLSLFSSPGNANLYKESLSWLLRSSEKDHSCEREHKNCTSHCSHRFVGNNFICYLLWFLIFFQNHPSPEFSSIFENCDWILFFFKCSAFSCVKLLL